MFAGSLPRDVEDDFYAEAIRDLNRRGVQCVLDCEGEPLRVGVEAEPFLVAPNQREAESLVGQEFRADEDFLMALDDDRRPRRTQRADHRGDGLLRALPGGAAGRPAPRLDARLEPIAPVGAGDVLLAGFLAARFNDRPIDEALRHAVACAAASVLELGAGRFDPREAVRLSAGVELEELEQVSA